MFEGWVQIAIYAVVLIALTPPLGAYMARVYTPGETVLLERLLGRFERFLCRVLRVDITVEQDWKRYGRSLLVFSLIGWLVIVSATDSPRVGLSSGDLEWLLERVPAEVMILRPAPEDTRRISAEGVSGHF